MNQIILLFFERIARRKASFVLVICIAFLFTLFNNELLMTSIYLLFFEVFGISYGINSDIDWKMAEKNKTSREIERLPAFLI